MKVVASLITKKHSNLYSYLVNKRNARNKFLEQNLKYFVVSECEFC